VLRVLLTALADRRLHPGKTVLDSSSGYVGIAYAMIGQIVGLPVETRRVSGTREKRYAYARARHLSRFRSHALQYR
jgi:cysteine synthase